MTDVGTSQDEPGPRLVGTPAQVTIKLFVNDKLVGEAKAERPNEAEARAFCRDLQLEIEALIRTGRLQ